MMLREINMDYLNPYLSNDNTIREHNPQYVLEIQEAQWVFQLDGRRAPPWEHAPLPDGVAVGQVGRSWVVAIVEMKSFHNRSALSAQLFKARWQILSAIWHFRPACRCAGCHDQNCTHRAHGDEHHDRWLNDLHIDAQDLQTLRAHSIVGVIVLFQFAGHAIHRPRHPGRFSLGQVPLCQVKDVAFRVRLRAFPNRPPVMWSIRFQDLVS